MRLTAYGNLGQMRHDDHLVGLGQVGQHLGKSVGGGSAHTGIDLVEHQCVDLVNLPQHDLHSKHHAADLAARSDASQRARLHAGTGPEQKLDCLGTGTRPRFTREILRRAHQLRTAHLEPRHLCGDRRSETGRRLAASSRKRLGGIGKAGLRLIHRAFGRSFAFSRVINQRNQLCGLGATSKHVFHARTVRAHQPLHRRHALLLFRQKIRIELYAVTIVTRFASDILQNISCLAQRFSIGSERFIEARRTFQRRNGRTQRIERAPVAGKRRMCSIRRRRERLRMFRARKLGGNLFVFAFLGVDRINLPQRETRFIQTRRRGLPCRTNALELCFGVLCLRKRFLIGSQRRSHILARPCIQHVQMLGRLHQALVLVLAAQVDGRSNCLRQLPHACHVPVQRDARTPVGGHAANGDNFAVLIRGAIPFRNIHAEKPARHRKGIGAFAYGRFVCTLAHQQLQRGKQRRLASTRLACEHGQAARGRKRRLADQRKVLYLDFIDHASCPFLGSPSFSISIPAVVGVTAPLRQARLPFGFLEADQYEVLAYHDGALHQHAVGCQQIKRRGVSHARIQLGLHAQRTVLLPRRVEEAANRQPAFLLPFGQLSGGGVIFNDMAIVV